MKINDYTIKDLVNNKGYTDDSYAQRFIYLRKEYNRTLYVTIAHNFNRPNEIRLTFLLRPNGIIDDSIFSNFPEEELQEQLKEIFGHCGVTTGSMKDIIQIMFYLDKEETLIKWVDLLEDDNEEFISLVFDLINDIGEK